MGGGGAGALMMVCNHYGKYTTLKINFGGSNGPPPLLKAIF